MEDQEDLAYESLVGETRVVEDDDEDYCSCCEEGEEPWKETEELDEFSVKMFFKGISLAEFGDSISGFSGIGVVMERFSDIQVIQVQKRLDFYVDESMADYLALMDGLTAAMQHKICRVYAFTDSPLLYHQIINGEKLDNPLLMAMRERILEHTRNLEEFVLELAPSINLLRPLQLARVAIGVVSCPAEGDKSLESCSICREEKPALMTMNMKCSHRFCSHCMRTYVEGKLRSSQVPIRCPALRCKYYISTAECRSFLPLASYESLEKAQAEADVLHSDGIYCPYPNCSILLDPRACLSNEANSPSRLDNSCVECAVCQRFICVDCGVPWHSSMSCEEYLNLPLEERGAADIALHRLVQNKKWKRCQQCRRIIELTQGCYHMTCWCGHEFCYSCGAEYMDGQQTCQCAFWDDDSSEDDSVTHSVQEPEQWAWETIDPFPMIMDTYSDEERSQLELIQRFLAGGFTSDHHPYQSPPRCTDPYADVMKDIHQLPWLERFASVMSDNYYEDYIQ